MTTQRIKQIFLSLLCAAVMHTFYAQDNTASSKTLSLPSAYIDIKTDAGRMQFLMKVIADSLEEGQLTHVLNWSRIGLQMADKNKVDSMKGIFLYDIGKAFTYYYNKYDSAIFYYKQVLPYFPDQLRKYHVFSLREIMDRYADLGNKDSSFAYMDRIKTLVDTMPDSSPRKIGLSQNIAVIYQGFGMYRTAIRYFQVAIIGNRENKNSGGLGIALANLAELYNQVEDYEKAINTAKEALINLKDVNMPYMQTAANTAEYYITIAKYDSAKVYLDISNEVAEKTNNIQARMANKSIMARIYTSQKKYTEAKRVLEEARIYFSETDNSWDQCRLLLSYADLDSSLNKYEDAKKHLSQVIEISKKNEFLPFTVEALGRLSMVYSKTGNFKSALDYHIQYTLLKDSLASSKSKAELNDLEISYKTTQKEQEIELLKKDNSIKNLELADNRRSKFLYIGGCLAAIILFAVFYYQRNQRNKIRFQKLKAELENKVLRLQMNPHFIFNSLNSIENFIMQNERRLASDYLNKFAKLIRMILDSSRDEAVPVANDMEALQLYIDLEQLRFNNKFSYKTYIDPALMTGDYRVPSLLIQPYVENAIVHGLAHSEEKDLSLTVTATLVDEKIKYVVQDNGIGRDKAKEYNNKNKPYHQSIGLQITETRINIFNKEVEKKDSVVFTDLFDENRKPDGTKVEIIIKAA